MNTIEERRKYHTQTVELWDGMFVTTRDSLIDSLQRKSIPTESTINELLSAIQTISQQLSMRGKAMAALQELNFKYSEIERLSK